jgi:HSP20 family protein
MTKEKAMSELKVASRSKTEDGAGQKSEIASHTASSSAVGSSSPSALMRRFAHEMDELFEDFGLRSRFRMPRFLTRGHELLRREAGFIPADWSPRVDIVERDGRFLVRADLPGLSKDDIKVDVTDDVLTIQGERKHEAKKEREGYYYSECSYGSFFRAIPLPEGADASKATADFDKGVLEVAVPTPPKPAPKAQRLEIKESK